MLCWYIQGLGYTVTLYFLISGTMMLAILHAARVCLVCPTGHGYHLTKTVIVNRHELAKFIAIGSFASRDQTSKGSMNSMSLRVSCLEDARSSQELIVCRLRKDLLLGLRLLDAAALFGTCHNCPHQHQAHGASWQLHSWHLHPSSSQVSS